jgi:peptidoglycan biosynthesis protein MviN/MurJ (putative lipid II flippase)
MALLVWPGAWHLARFYTFLFKSLSSGTNRLCPDSRFILRGMLSAKLFLFHFHGLLLFSSNEIAEFFLITMAAGLSVGAISIFNFSWNLQSVPLSVIGVSYSLAAFPVLTKLFVKGDTQKFVDQMIISTKHIIFWSVPVMVLFIVLRAQIVRVILGWGRFDWTDTRLTAAALALFVFSLIPQSLVTLFVRAYYSRSDTKKPLLMNVISAGLIITLSFLLVKTFYSFPFFRYFIESLLRVSDITQGTEVLMLPLGFSIGVTLNMFIHWIAFEWDFPGYTASFIRSVFQILSASIIMGAITYMYLDIFGHIYNINTFSGIFQQGLYAGLIGICVGIGMLVILGNKEIREVGRAFKHKIWKAKVVPADPTGV